MSTEAIPSIETPNDNSVPAKSDTPALLGADPKETFRNAMRAEADREGARSAKADPEPPTPEAKPAPKADAPAEVPKPAADDIPESLLKPATPKAEEAPTDDVPPELHGNTSKSVREHFAKQGEHYKAKLAKTGEEMAALRKELEGARASNGKPSAEHLLALEAIKKERDDYLARLERVAYQESPAFQEKFTAREERLRGVAEKIFEDVGADKAILSQALAMSGKRRDEFLDEQETLGSTTKARLASVLGQLDVLAEERTADIATSREKLASMRAAEAAEQKAEEERRAAEDKAILEEVLKTARETTIGLREVPGNDAWNSGVKDRIAKIYELSFGNNDTKTLMEFAVAAVNAQVTDRINQKLMERVATLEAKLNGMSAVEPVLNGRDKPLASDEERIARMSPDERARHTFRQLAAPYVGH